MLFDKLKAMKTKDKRQVLGVIMMFAFVYGAMVAYGQILFLFNRGVIMFLGSIYLNVSNVLLILICYYLLTQEFKYERLDKK